MHGYLLINCTKCYDDVNLICNLKNNSHVAFLNTSITEFGTTSYRNIYIKKLNWYQKRQINSYARRKIQLTIKLYVSTFWDQLSFFPEQRQFKMKWLKTMIIFAFCIVGISFTDTLLYSFTSTQHLLQLIVNCNTIK